MPRVSFESLPAYGFVGGTIAGVMAVETDRPTDANRVSVSLHGAEISQTTVSRGKQTEVITDRRPFLELNFVPVTLGTVGPGSVQLPFSFTIPADSPPSIATHAVSPTRGRVFSRSNGLYVEYELEGRIDVPWWVDPIDREVVPIYSTRRVLGAVLPVRSLADGRRPSITVDADTATVIPGQLLSGSFVISNPAGQHLRSLEVGVQRSIQYSTRGIAGRSFGPSFSVVVPLDTRDATRAGRFSIPIPNVPEATGPWQGALFQAFWNFTLQIDVALGFDVRFSEALGPG
ncbi:MAG TPA: hypothetical protein VIZ68_00835 [Thermoplasmata archaeon]